MDTITKSWEKRMSEIIDQNSVKIPFSDYKYDLKIRCSTSNLKGMKIEINRNKAALRKWGVTMWIKMLRCGLLRNSRIKSDVNFEREYCWWNIVVNNRCCGVGSVGLRQLNSSETSKTRWKGPVNRWFSAWLQHTETKQW